MGNVDLEIPRGIQTPYWLSSMQKTRIAHTFSPNDWIKDRYGAYLWDDSAIDQASTRSGWEYVGKELPNGVHRLDILTEIDGRLYHKNTNDVFASLFNYLDADFVEHKPYEPVTAKALNEGIATGAGYAAGGLALRGVSGITGSAKSFIKFSSKVGRSPAGQRTFSFQARFPKSNLNIRLDRGFRAPLKGMSKSPYFGKPYNGFNTHLNIQKPGSFNYHFPLNPLKWKYYNVP